MMRPHLFLILFLAMAKVSATAQSYTPFPTADATWNEYERAIEQVGFIYHAVGFRYALAGDTTIGGLNYVKLAQYDTWNIDQNFPQGINSGGNNLQFNGIVSAIREDADRRIWIRFFERSENSLCLLCTGLGDNTSISLEQDYLLYDFGLMPGEVFHTPLGDDRVFDHEEFITLTDGSTRRTMYMESCELGGVPQVWIEGIGCRLGLLAPLTCSYGFGEYNFCGLQCFNPSDFPIYQPVTELLGHTIYCGELLNIVRDPAAAVPMHIWPNPSLGGMQIELPNSATAPFELRILNQYGHTLKQLSAMGGTSVLLSEGELSPGLYFCLLLRNGALVTTEKLVVL